MDLRHSSILKSQQRFQRSTLHNLMNKHPLQEFLLPYLARRHLCEQATFLGTLLYLQSRFLYLASSQVHLNPLLIQELKQHDAVFQL